MEEMEIGKKVEIGYDEGIRFLKNLEDDDPGYEALAEDLESYFEDEQTLTIVYDDEEPTGNDTFIGVTPDNFYRGATVNPEDLLTFFEVDELDGLEEVAH